MPDLLAGSTVLAQDTPPEGDGRATAFWTFTITTYGKTVATGTTPAAGFTFMAPTTGRVAVTISAQMRGAAAADAPQMSYEIRTGAVVGSGTVFLAVADGNSVTAGSTTYATAARRRIVSGLTPGTTYNIDLLWKVTAGTGTATNVDLVVEPAT